MPTIVCRHDIVFYGRHNNYNFHRLITLLDGVSQTLLFLFLIEKTIEASKLMTDNHLHSYYITIISLIILLLNTQSQIPLIPGTLFP